MDGNFVELPRGASGAVSGLEVERGLVSGPAIGGSSARIRAAEPVAEPVGVKNLCAP